MVDEETRINNQRGRVRQWLYANVGRWVLVEEFTFKKRGEGSAAITARIRDMRKARFGSHEIKCRRREAGLYEYKLVARVK